MIQKRVLKICISMNQNLRIKLLVPVEDIMANLNIISSLAILTKALEEMNLLFEIMNILQNYCLK